MKLTLLTRLLNCCILIGTMMYGVVQAQTFSLPPRGNEVVGKIFTVRARGGDTLASVARRYDIGFDEIASANPRLSHRSYISGKKVVVPNVFILPSVAWRGIVINIAEKRLYYFPKGRNVVETFPVGIGREGDQTPLMNAKVIQKKKNPDWRPPASVKAAALAQHGVELPDVVPAGPENPLGDYMMRLSRHTYLIHGTINPAGVGRRVSSGCVRMYPEDIEHLFGMTRIGTPVRIVHEAFKAGWRGPDLLFEAHNPLSEHGYQNDHSTVMSAIKRSLAKPPFDIDWMRIRRIGSQRHGVPVVVGSRNLDHGFQLTSVS